MSTDNYAIPAGGEVWNKFGRTTNADAGVVTDVWDGANATDDQDIWIAPTEPRIHSLVSTSADDTNSGGSGARSVIVFGLRAWDAPPVMERVFLAGLTPVNTQFPYVVINHIQVCNCGGTSINAGKITATAATDSTVTAQINANAGMTLSSVFGVGMKDAAYITAWFCSILRPAADKNVFIQLMMNREPDLQTTGFIGLQSIGLQTDGSTSFSAGFSPYARLAGPALIKVQATASGADSDVMAGYDMVVTSKPGSERMLREIEL